MTIEPNRAAEQAAHPVTAPFRWRDHLQVHPAAEFFPLLPPAELEALADDITAHGLQTRIALWEDPDPDRKFRALLDGRNHLDALALAGLFALDDNGHLCIRGRDGDRRAIRAQLCTGDPYDLVLSFNIIAATSRPSSSNRAIAKQADDKTVAKVRADLQRRSDIPHVETRTDTKGRQQPSAKPRRAVSPVDAALIAFDAHLLELLLKTKGFDPARFAKTEVKAAALARLASFLADLRGKERRS